jgi:hypothetical protein
VFREPVVIVAVSLLADVGPEAETARGIAVDDAEEEIIEVTGSTLSGDVPLLGPKGTSVGDALEFPVEIRTPDCGSEVLAGEWMFEWLVGLTLVGALPVEVKPVTVAVADTLFGIEAIEVGPEMDEFLPPVETAAGGLTEIKFVEMTIEGVTVPFAMELLSSVEAVGNPVVNGDVVLSPLAVSEAGTPVKLLIVGEVEVVLSAVAAPEAKTPDTPLDRLDNSADSAVEDVLPVNMIEALKAPRLCEE